MQAKNRLLLQLIHSTIFLNAAETFLITRFILRTTNPSDLLFPLPFKYNLHHTDSLITSLLISLSLAHALHTRQVVQLSQQHDEGELDRRHTAGIEMRDSICGQWGEGSLCFTQRYKGSHLSVSHTHTGSCLIAWTPGLA